jgi:lysophospholipase L1-like esterase
MRRQPSAPATGTTPRPSDPGRLRLATFALTPAFVLACALAVFWWWRPPQGKALNQLAWESTFSERGLPVPPSGPRDGYWGARLAAKVPDDRLGWHEAAVAVPGLLDIDANGQQHYRSGQNPKRSVVIFGGSVAFGGYASSIATTYFHVLGDALQRLGTPADITVVASGAWKARQEGVALEHYGTSPPPDLIVFLNGLNDLTSGAASDTLFGQQTATRDGSSWTQDYHAHDYDQRVADYLEIMRRVGLFTRMRGNAALVVLQPSLAERAQRTSIEERLLDLSLVPHESASALQRSYQAMRDGLANFERSGTIQFLDCSRLFDSERATTFTDLWHFSDAGHRLLGEAMAGEIAAVLGARPHLP